MERRCRERAQRLAASDGCRQLSTEHLVDDEPRVVVVHVQFAQEPGVGRDVHRPVAVGEHLVDLSLVLLRCDVIDVGPELFAETVADLVEQGDDPLTVAQAFALSGDASRCQLHARYWDPWLFVVRVLAGDTPIIRLPEPRSR